MSPLNAKLNIEKEDDDNKSKSAKFEQFSTAKPLTTDLLLSPALPPQPAFPELISPEPQLQSTNYEKYRHQTDERISRGISRAEMAALMQYTARSPPYRPARSSSTYIQMWPCGRVKKSTAVCILLILITVFVGISIFKKLINTKFPRAYTVPSSRELAYRREFVRNMTASAFGAYQKYAWGHPELRPVSRRPFTDVHHPLPGLTILASMSTLWVMGLEREWAAGKEWISAHLLPLFQNHQGRLDCSDTIESAIGGLLSAYALSGEKVFFDRALQVFQNMPEDLFRVFPVGYLPQYYHAAANRTVPLKGNYSKKEVNVDFQQPELIYLANLTGTWSEGGEQSSSSGEQWLSWWLATARATVVNSVDGVSLRGFHAHKILAKNGDDWLEQVTWRPLDFAFYQNMLLSYEQLGGWDSWLLEKFGEAVHNTGKRGQFAVVHAGNEGHKKKKKDDEEWSRLREDNDLLYVRDFNDNDLRYWNRMSYQSCRLGGQFALSAVANFRRDISEKHLKVSVLDHFHSQFQSNSAAANKKKESKWFSQGKVHLALAHFITKTCYQQASATKTNLLPETFWRDGVYSSFVNLK